MGIELGVAGGWFSKRLVETGCFERLWAVDMYGDHHDTDQYIKAVKRVGIAQNYKLLRMRFDQARRIFPREYFDFIYVDGYAHTGENNGRTIFQWFNQLKVGGMIAGHDYHEKWPLVQRAVDVFADLTGGKLMVTQLTKDPDPQDKYPSWAIIKEHPGKIYYPDMLKNS